MERRVADTRAGERGRHHVARAELQRQVEGAERGNGGAHGVPRHEDRHIGTQSAAQCLQLTDDRRLQLLVGFNETRVDTCLQRLVAFVCWLCVCVCVVFLMEHSGDLTRDEQHTIASYEAYVNRP